MYVSSSTSCLERCGGEEEEWACPVARMFEKGCDVVMLYYGCVSELPCERAFEEGVTAAKR